MTATITHLAAYQKTQPTTRARLPKDADYWREKCIEAELLAGGYKVDLVRIAERSSDPEAVRIAMEALQRTQTPDPFPGPDRQ